VVQRLGEIYDTIRDQATEALESADKEVTKYVEQLNASSTSEPQAALPEASDGNKAADETKVGDSEPKQDGKQ
jgi:hypothetical protein